MSSKPSGSNAGAGTTSSCTEEDRTKFYLLNDLAVSWRSVCPSCCDESFPQRSFALGLSSRSNCSVYWAQWGNGLWTQWDRGALRFDLPRVFHDGRDMRDGSHSWSIVLSPMGEWQATMLLEETQILENLIERWHSDRVQSKHPSALNHLRSSC